MKKDSRIFITDHEGLVGSALARRLERDGFKNLLLRGHSELDLLDPAAVSGFFEALKPEYVFSSSAKSGGIKANMDLPAEFLYHNLQMQNNIIHSSWAHGVKRLIFAASSCVYPKDSPQPMKEEYLLTGALEPTSEPTAVAKIAGIKMCQYYRRQYKADFISVIPATIYGPGDDFDVETGHVIPALIRKFHEAKVLKEPFVAIWGTGEARREFIHADDVTDACVFLMEKGLTGNDAINIGSGGDISISELAGTLKEITGFAGEIKFDGSRPDGALRKLLGTDRLKSLGWAAKTGLRAGLDDLYKWYVYERKNCHSGN